MLGTYTVLTVPANNALLLTNAKPGDIVRAAFTTDGFGNTTYSSYTIQSILSEGTAHLVSGPAAPISVAALVEVWHPFSKNEQAAAVAASAGVYADRRVCAVWPDTLGDAGTQVPGYFLCCALAGQASGVLPQQDLTNAALKGFDDLSRSNKYFNTTQLNTIAASGGWIVTQDPSGTVYTRDALTTDTTDVVHEQEMVRRNVDSISFTLLDGLSPFIGKINATPNALELIHNRAVSLVTALESNGIVTALGPQIISTGDIAVMLDPTAEDTVIVTIPALVPKALKHLPVYLVIA